jgi:uncharacterized cupin superfamily protein
VAPEAQLERTDAGLVPKGEGWFVLNARDARWAEGEFGAFTRFEGEPRFSQFGINIAVLEPGQPACMYHGENEQEDFLVLAGECLLLIEGAERRLKAWDFVHCPPWTEHVFVGESPCILLAVGSRTGGDVVYPAAPFAQKHGAAVEQETRDPVAAYAGFKPDEAVEYREGWLPA